MPRLRMSGALHPPPYVFIAWCLIKHRDNFSQAKRNESSFWEDNLRMEVDIFVLILYPTGMK
jgi:hypothetical protein